jgi:hypothetical protein
MELKFTEGKKRIKATFGLKSLALAVFGAGSSAGEVCAPKRTFITEHWDPVRLMQAASYSSFL